ncbi:MAG: urease accessory protein UreF [Alphaproteobacteria bacterium]
MADPADVAALYRLLAWMSPSYPVGAFSYSHGLEWAVEQGDIISAASLIDWLDVVISEGSGLADATLFVQAHRAVMAHDPALLAEANAMALALQPSRERRLETTAQGNAFVMASEAAWPVAAFALLRSAVQGSVAYPVAVGVTAAGHGIEETMAVHAYLHAVAANLVSAAVRLVPLGQTDGLRVVAALEPIVSATVARARDTALDDIGGAALRSDIASMRHETQYTRLFRS